MPYLFLPIPLLGLFNLLKRRQSGLLLLLPAAIFCLLYWPYLRPRQHSETAADFSVMTYNVLFSNRQYDQVAAVINRYQPDLVALQEVRPGMMARLQTTLAADYPYALLGDQNPYGTTAVFSRHPFLEQTILDLGDDRPATIVTVHIGNRPVTFAAVHLRAYGLRWVPPLQIPQAIVDRTHLQNQQARILLDYLAAGPAIIACDCNAYETSYTYRLLAQTYKNAAHENGRPPPPGTRAETRLSHLDYILYQGPFNAIGTYLINNSGGSDHQPLITQFAHLP